MSSKLLSRFFFAWILVITFPVMGQWTTYNFAGTGIFINEPTSIKITNSSEVWIGTRDMGIAVYNNNNWNMYDISNSGFPNNYIRTLHTFGNTVFCGTGYNGIGRYSSNSWSTINQASTSGGLADDEVLGLAHNGSGYLWVATYNGLSVDSITKWRTYKTSNTPGMPSNLLTSLAIDLLDQKWIGTMNHGLVRFNNTSWQTFNTGNSPLPSNTINKVAISPDNTLWICTPNGVVRFDRVSTWNVYNSSNTPVIKSNVFNDIAFDNSGNVFFATEEGVITRNAAGNWFRTHTGNSNLPSNHITCITVNNSDQKVWVGTLNSGVAHAHVNTLFTSRTEGQYTPGTLRVFPNPCSEEINIVGEFAHSCPEVEFSMLTLSGNIVSSEIISPNAASVVNHRMNISHLPPGIYLLKITTSAYTEIKKVLKH